MPLGKRPIHNGVIVSIEQIENDIGPMPRSKGANPSTELEFSTDLDADFDVSIETFSGNIAIRVGG